MVVCPLLDSKSACLSLSAKMERSLGGNDQHREREVKQSSDMRMWWCCIELDTLKEACYRHAHSLPCLHVYGGMTVSSCMKRDLEQASESESVDRVGVRGAGCTECTCNGGEYCRVCYHYAHRSVVVRIQEASLSPP